MVLKILEFENFGYEDLVFEKLEFENFRIWTFGTQNLEFEIRIWIWGSLKHVMWKFRIGGLDLKIDIEHGQFFEICLL